MGVLLGVLLSFARAEAASDPARAAQGPIGAVTSVAMTVEIDWAAPANIGAVPVEIELNAGRIAGAVAIPLIGGDRAEPTANGGLQFRPAASGRIRARVEAPLSATLTVKAGTQTVPIPLARLVDGPQRTVAPATIDVGVARVAWDVVEFDAGEFQGSAAPGEKFPVRVAFNLLAPEPSEVNLHFTAELKSARGQTAIWQFDQKAVVTTNSLQPTPWILPLVAPPTEGLYTLEVRASWEPVAEVENGSRISRLLRRKKNATGGGGSVVRRTNIAVVATTPKPATEKSTQPTAPEKVDSITLSTPHNHRPSASGRAPLDSVGWRIPEAAIVEETRRDRIRGWVPRLSDPVTLGAADSTGLAWAAVGLRVPHPDRPHRLTVTIAGGHPSALGVGMVANSGPGGKPRLVLDVCVAGPPQIEGIRPQTYSWIVWPEAAEPVLLLVNRNPSAPVQPGTVTLTELPELAPAPAVTAPHGEPRVVGLDLTSPAALERFGSGGDPIVGTQNLMKYLAFCGATSVVLPETLADRAGRQALNGQADEDVIAPDRLDVVLTMLARKSIAAWIDVDTAAPLPDLPHPASAEALEAGIARVDRQGKSDGGVYYPIHPKVRAAMSKRVENLAKIRTKHQGVSGLLVRLGPGSTLLGRPDTGLDDTTYERFVADTFDAGLAKSIPGRGNEDANRFETRARFIEAQGPKPWFTWRARQIAAVYSELTEVARRTSTGITLAVATPDLDSGLVGDEIRRLDRTGAGPAQAWRAVGLDLAHWPTDANAPVILRGQGLSNDELARDVATSPELDDQIAARPARGVWLGLSRSPQIQRDSLVLTSPAMPEGVSGDEPLGHGLAALDGRWFFASGAAVAGREDSVRKFALAVRALPSPAPEPTTSKPTSGVSARISRSGGAAYLAMANDTPYPIQFEATLSQATAANFVDLSHSATLTTEPVDTGLKLRADLPPFGVASARVDEATVIERTSIYPGSAVLDGMKAQYDDLSVTLAKLNHLATGAAGSGPANPDFEAPIVRLTSSRTTSGVEGWQILGGEGGTIALDTENSHGGRSSLKLDATKVPLSLVSETFTPIGHPSVTIHAWLRSDNPDARVRLWIEGQVAGRPFIRQLEVAPKAEWTPTAARVSGLPSTGFDSARLRFELLTPGKFWFDDLSVSGPALTEAERLNARRDLMAALSAYRDHRYADFARLASSHWTRHVAAEPAATGRLAGDRSGLIRTGETSPTALPSNRRIR